MKNALCLLFIMLVFCAWGGGWNEGDLNIQKFSINGDPTEGIAFDPDNDSDNEVFIHADGSLSLEGNLTASAIFLADGTSISGGAGSGDITSVTAGGLLSGGGVTGAVTLTLGVIDISSATTVSGTLRHENGGLEADASSYNGFLTISGGSTSARALAAGDIPDLSGTYEVQLNNEAGLYAVLSDVTDFMQSDDLSTNAELVSELAVFALDSDITNMIETADSASLTDLSITTNLEVAGTITSDDDRLLSNVSKSITFTVTKPLDLDEADTLPVWKNETGKTFVICEIKADSDTDDTVFTLANVPYNNYSDLSVIGVVQVNVDGNNVYTDTLSASDLSYSEVLDTNVIVFNNDAADDPNYISCVIEGYYKP